MQSNFAGPDQPESYPPPLHPPQYGGYGGPPPLPHPHEGQYLVPPGLYSPTGVPSDPKDYNSLMPIYHQDSWNNNSGDRQSPSAYDCYWLTPRNLTWWPGWPPMWPKLTVFPPTPTWMNCVICIGQERCRSVSILGAHASYKSIAAITADPEVMSHNPLKIEWIKFTDCLVTFR
jgi:hypothetical protein